MGAGFEPQTLCSQVIQTCVSECAFRVCFQSGLTLIVYYSRVYVPQCDCQAERVELWSVIELFLGLRMVSVCCNKPQLSEVSE
jgi:hypothetical protein